MTVRRLLDLSTAHLPEDVMNGPDVGPLHSIDGVIAWRVTCELGPGAALIWVPDDPTEHAADYDDIPPEVLAVQLYARSLGCDFVLFDQDSNTDASLPTWDW